MLPSGCMQKDNDFNIDFDLPVVEASKPAARRMHISDSVCESCEG